MHIGYQTQEGARDRWGLTLLELVVVVAILAVLTGVAVRTASNFGMEARDEATRRTVEAFRGALVGNGTRGAGVAGAETSGFVADMGRLPRSDARMLGDLGWVVDVGELHAEQVPAGLVPFGVHGVSAQTTELMWVGGSPGTHDGLVLSGGLRVPAGWRGPYLRRAVGESVLSDGWGKPLVNRVTDYGTNIWDMGGWPVVLLCVRTNAAVQTWCLPADMGYAAILDAGREVSGVWVRPGFEGGGEVVDGAGQERWTAVREVEYRADPVVVQVRDVQGRTSAGATLLVMWYGPNPEMAVQGRPVRATVQSLGMEGSVMATNVIFAGAAAPTVGTRVFRACLVGAGPIQDTGPVYVPVSRGMTLVSLELP